MGSSTAASANGTTRTFPPSKIAPLLARFGRTDEHIQWGRTGWFKAYEELTVDLVRRHLAGELTVGAYPSTADGHAKVGVIDVDVHPPEGREPDPTAVIVAEAYAVKKADELRARGVDALLVRHHPLGSFHLVFFVAHGFFRGGEVAPLPAAALGAWLAAFTADRGAVHVDCFPSSTGGGNAVRLPGRHHRLPDAWSEAWDGGGWEPWPAAPGRLVALAENPPGLFLNAGPDPAADTPPKPEGGGKKETRPGDVFDLLVPIDAVLAHLGWQPTRESGDRVYWARPGKDGGVSGSVLGNSIWVFTSSIPGLRPSTETKLPYTGFALVAHLAFGGDFKKAARELAAHGFVPKPPADGPRVTVGVAAEAAASPPAPEWPDPPDDAAFHGLAGAIARAIEPASEADPAAILVQTLVAFGNAIGRSAHFEVEATRHYANEYAVLMGATAKGRKGTSWDQVRAPFRAAAGGWVDDCIQSGLSSGEGLIWAVRDEIEKQEKVGGRGEAPRYEAVVADPGVADKRLLVVEPEFANVLKQTERQGNTLSVVVRQGWESGNLRSLTKNSPARATGAHISQIGHITAEELTRYLSATESANGFGNRYCWFLVRRSKLLPEGGRPDRGLMAGLETRLEAAIRFGSSAELVARDDAAREVWAGVYGDLSAGRPGLAGALLGRAEAHVMRFALIYALMDRSAAITDAHLEAALALWEYAERSVLFVFGDTLGDPLADDLLRLIRGAAGLGITRTDIGTYLGRNVPSEKVNRALGLLVRHRLAEPRKENTGGRPAEKWFAVGR